MQLPVCELRDQQGVRLVNSKFPPMSLFDDVASPAEFDALFALQALTNPRLLNDMGVLNLLPVAERPLGIPGAGYAVAPFTHVNPQGSRFSNGDFGVLYIADRLETAIAEVRFHQQQYWQGVQGLHYDRLVFRALQCRFDAVPCADASQLPLEHAIYHPSNYQTAQLVGAQLRRDATIGVRYRSVRQEHALCVALFTPRQVHSMVQSCHVEMIWDGRRISAVHQLSNN